MSAVWLAALVALPAIGLLALVTAGWIRYACWYVPRWVRSLRRRRRTPVMPSVGPWLPITFQFDPTDYAAAISSLGRAFEGLDFRMRIQQERLIGRRYVDGLLNQMCLDLGLDPAVARKPMGGA